ncbi:uncharacterized protein [Dermacentor andersoni]|uniref:uncharacterized protein n=1 Tax=Dermacentor andersoni TaxID=34620 RepID=UPI0024172F48|nr:uncharacterized protein LOC126530271 [Dermacentor andersoni]
MFTLPLLLCMLAVASVFSSNSSDYAEDPKHYDEQNYSDMQSVNETIFILQRNYKNNTPFRCISGTKYRVVGESITEYTLKARWPNGTYISYKVNMTATTTGNHTCPNAVFYQEDPTEDAMNHKIVTMDTNHTCFVVVRDNNATQHECYLAVTASAADRNVSSRCQTVYTTYCPGPSVILYNSTCQQETS